MIVILIILIIYTVFLNIMLQFFYKGYRLCKLELDLIKTDCGRSRSGEIYYKDNR